MWLQVEAIEAEFRGGVQPQMSTSLHTNTKAHHTEIKTSLHTNTKHYWLGEISKEKNGQCHIA